MLWGCFSWNVVGPLVRIVATMDATYYVCNILEAVMTLQWGLQQDNEPKHTSKKAKEWFRSHKINVLKWAAQSPELNPIKHLWMDVKKGIRAAKPKIF